MYRNVPCKDSKCIVLSPTGALVPIRKLFAICNSL